jgi:2-amino-4-hydroxy-6-hydroxymethyldihydropteridine diphosphokinase
MPLKSVYIGLGSNMGDRLSHLKEAIFLLEKMNALVVTQSSAIYENRAIGISDGHDFYNAVIEGFTDLSPLELLKSCQAVEQKMGRIKTDSWTNRIIDLDILWYEGVFLSEEKLSIPHPNILKRDFVLKPLCAINPSLLIKNASHEDQAVNFLKALDTSGLNELENRLWPLGKINQIVAVAKNGVIGKNGVLPWSIEEDWKIFLRKTRNGILIMGRLSFQEMIKEPDWDNSRSYIVLSHQAPKSSHDAVKYTSNLEDALRIAEASGKTIWICGGESIYESSLEISDVIHLTRINRVYEGDTHFPDFETRFGECHSKIDSNFKDLKYTFELWIQEK